MKKVADIFPECLIPAMPHFRQPLNPPMPLRHPNPMNTQNQTTITDIDIPFGRLVVIILKLMLAALPAVILFYAVAGLLTYLAVMLMQFDTPKIDFLPRGDTRQQQSTR